MKHNHRLILSITMIICVVIVAIVLSSINFFEYKKQVESNEELQLTQVENKAKIALDTLNKAYVLFYQELTDNMKSNSNMLVEKYKDEPNFSLWNFDRLSEEFGVDVYIIDQKNVVIHSNVSLDIGLDFSACCQKLLPFFESVRKNGKFASPGIDVEQATGLVKKYSYEGTDDGKYIIELGYAAHNDEIFDSFNILQDTESLYEQYDLILDLRILNIGGLALAGKQNKLSNKRREAFEETLKSKEQTEVVDKWNGEESTYRYIYYESKYSSEEDFDEVVEVVYDHKQTEQTVSKSLRTLIVQLVIVFAIIALISLIIHFWVSQHVYSAQHDSLTDLKNRSMFEEILELTLEDEKPCHALMMIDLDNFKTVNDTLGHIQGDHVLKVVAKTLKDVADSFEESLSVYRVGGDEFTIIMPKTDEDSVVKVAEKINRSLRQSLTANEKYRDLKVSASIGISMSEENEHTDPQTLYQQADIALNKCKQHGKNGYNIFEDTEKV